MTRNIELSITLSQSEFLYLITQCPVVVFGTVQLTSAIPHTNFHYLSSLSSQRASYGMLRSSAIFFLISAPFLCPLIMYERYCFVTPSSSANLFCSIPFRTKRLLIKRVFGLYIFGFLGLFASFVIKRVYPNE